MSDGSARQARPPTPPAPDPRPDPSPLLDILRVPVPIGLTEPPLDSSHILDIHLGNTVHTTCSIESRERRGLQAHGSFCVLPAGASGRWFFERPAHALLVRLTPALFLETAETMGLRNAELNPSIHVRDPQIERLGWILQAEHDDGYASGRLFTDSLATAVAARLLSLQSRGAPSAVKPSRALPGRQLRNVLDYIEEHLDESLTLAELAAVAGFSLSHFKPLFRQAVGRPVHRYVLERRVERARTLLLTGNRTMIEIALEAGFAHQSHMARCVRRLLGVSPSQIASSVTRRRPTVAAPPRR
jgi:AraC family transcriptional regulator